jgi:hypothetical protein
MNYILMWDSSFNSLRTVGQYFEKFSEFHEIILSKKLHTSNQSTLRPKHTFYSYMYLSQLPKEALLKFTGFRAYYVVMHYFDSSIEAQWILYTMYVVWHGWLEENT